MADRPQPVTPHLVVHDANAALDYYKKALAHARSCACPLRTASASCIPRSR
jgi:uncharacterized glyoxalase superfamily protein PhnB